MATKKKIRKPVPVKQKVRKSTKKKKEECNKNTPMPKARKRK